MNYIIVSDYKETVRKYYGPFDSWNDAADYGDSLETAYWYIVELEK